MKTNKILRFLVVLVIAVGIFSYSLSPSFSKNVNFSQEPLSMWIELGENEQSIARVITESTSCPSIKIDRESYLMQIRVNPSDEFPVLICEFNIPVKSKSVQINGKKMPLPKQNPTRIAVIGDTGCRIKGKWVQSCNDPNQWPFQKLIESVANWNPDLVIHVGDYVYRQTPCPKDNKGCFGSAAGDFWQAWQDDFFSPADKLLRTSPWLFARGNHELCNKAGKGWFNFMYPRRQPEQCEDFTDPYSVSLGDFDILVMDSAIADDDKKVPSQVAKYTEQFKQLDNLTKKPSWLLIHRPIWGLKEIKGHKNTLTSHELILNQTLQAASGDHLPDFISLILSGHIHILQMLSFENERPVQSITGNSGTALDLPLSTEIIGQTIDNKKIADGTSIAKFGYMTLEHQNKGQWLGKVRGVDGSVYATCSIDNRKLNCTKSA